MKPSKKFIYPKCVRSNVDGKRVYDINNGKFKLPSVTTILSATQSADKQAITGRVETTSRRGPSNADRE